MRGNQTETLNLGGAPGAPLPTPQQGGLAASAPGSGASLLMEESFCGRDPLCDLGRLSDPLWTSISSPVEGSLVCSTEPCQNGRSQEDGDPLGGPRTNISLLL